MTIRNRKRGLANINFSSLRKRTEFPFALLLSQRRIEELLTRKIEALGSKVDRPTTLISLHPEADGIRAVVSSQGENREIFARVVVGADGSRSLVCVSKLVTNTPD